MMAVIARWLIGSRIGVALLVAVPILAIAGTVHLLDSRKIDSLQAQLVEANANLVTVTRNRDTLREKLDEQSRAVQEAADQAEAISSAAKRAAEQVLSGKAEQRASDAAVGANAKEMNSWMRDLYSRP